MKRCRVDLGCSMPRAIVEKIVPILFRSIDGTWCPERIPREGGWMAESPWQLTPVGVPAVPPRAFPCFLPVFSQRLWSLVVPSAARIVHNGEAVTSGLRVLAHGDWIRMGRTSLFFSMDVRAEPAAFEGPQSVQCPRCRDDIQVGQAAVCCPGCGVWHHQWPDLPCWRYAPTCSACEQTTGEDDHLWSPAVL